MTRIARVAVIAGCLLQVPPVFAKPTDAEKCEAAKLRAAGKNALCQAKVLAKLALGREADVAKCEAKFAAAFAKAEAKGGCGTAGDANFVAARLDSAFVVVGGVLDPGGRFQDNGDGTVTDFQTGLMWEEKVAGAGCLHCVEDLYTWSGASGADADGQVFTQFLAALNENFEFVLSPTGAATQGFLPPVVLAGCFANHCDWRLPTLLELQTIVSPSAPGGCNPCTQICVDPIFGARAIPAGIGVYWTSTVAGTMVPELFDILAVQFCGAEPGIVTAYDKILFGRARAVRGGY